MFSRNPLPVAARSVRLSRNRLMYASALATLAGFGSTAAAQDVLSADQLRASVLASDPYAIERYRDLDRVVAPLAYTPPVIGQPSLPPTDYVEPGVIGDAASWVTPEFQLDYGLAQMNAQFAYARGLTGKGILAGILDDGVEFRHTEFSGKNNQSITAADVLADGSLCAPVDGAYVLDGCFYTEGDVSARDFYVTDGNDRLGVLLQPQFRIPGTYTMLRVGHGTHVAGTIAANRDENGAHGVAFGASIVSARLFGDSISDLDSLVYAAFGAACPEGACTENRPQMSLEARTNVYRDFVASGVKVINNSWGFTFRTRTVADLDSIYTDNTDLFDPIFRATAEQTSAAGILQVFAAGNTPNDVAGLMASLPRFMPEYEPYWVAVANIDSTETIFAQSSICGAAAQWCVAAAGTNIWSSQFGSDAALPDGTGTVPPGYEFVYNDLGQPIGFRELAAGEIVTNAFKTLTGTSMATPHVTGALTLLFERYPYLQGTFVRDILLTTARDVGAEGVDDIYGWGIVDLQKAINGPGQLIKDSTVDMTTRAGGTKVWTGDAWDDWSNSISGVGRLTKTGAGWLRLSGTNTFNGATVNAGVLELTGANTLASSVDVTGGTLMIGGSLIDTPLNITGGSAIVTGMVTGGLTTVGSAGSLFGTGTLADTIVNGSITPGLSVNDLGRLNVMGAYTQNAGSTFNVATRPVSAAGLLSVTGTAALNGGTVNVLALPGLYQLSQTYTILTASGGVTGKFSGLKTTGLDLPFLAFSLNHKAAAVDLVVSRGASFTSVAVSPNERAVAGSVDALPNANAILNGLSQLTLAQGRTALDQISGEAYAGVQGALIDSGRSVREAAISRTGLGVDHEARGVSLWADARRSSGDRDAIGGYRGVTDNTTTYLVGADFGLSSTFALGVFGGWGRSDIHSPLAQNIDADSVHYGAYGSARFGALTLGGGGLVSNHETDVRRRIDAPGLAQQLRSESDYSNQQYFLDLGYSVPADGLTFQPFAQLVHLRASHDGLTETGGNLALSGEVEGAELNIGTAGVRFVTNGSDPAAKFRVSGMVGYRRAEGDLSPAARLAFTGGNAFVSGSAPLSDNALVVDWGLATDITRNVSLEAGYSAELAKRTDNHMGNIRLVMTF